MLNVFPFESHIAHVAHGVHVQDEADADAVDHSLRLLAQRDAHDLQEPS